VNQCDTFHATEQLQPGIKKTRAAASALPKAGVKPEGRNDLSIAFAFACSWSSDDDNPTPLESANCPSNKRSRLSQ
jgi:hypothetical protein